MTKKDYAACIGAAQTDTRNHERTIFDIALRLMTELALENPKFDKLKFTERIEYWRKNHGGN